MPPTLYGFIPRTYCAERVAARCSDRINRPGIKGDGDPLDVCVLTEKPITHGNLLVPAVPIGGLRMLDGLEAGRQDRRRAQGRQRLRRVQGHQGRSDRAGRSPAPLLPHLQTIPRQHPGRDRDSRGLRAGRSVGSHSRSLEDYRAKFP